MAKKEAAKTTINNVSNDGESALRMPFAVEVTIAGTSDLLFHRYGVDAVASKGAAAKNSAAKKTDDVESYLYRDDDGNICMPGEYLRQSIIEAARYRQDPRSPRKSMRDLMKAAIVALTSLAPVLDVDGKTIAEPHYIDRRRVLIQRNAVTRMRPAIRKGWRVSIVLQVQTPEYLDLALLSSIVADAGRLVGIADFRPTFGRFAQASIVRLEDESREAAE